MPVTRYYHHPRNYARHYAKGNVSIRLPLATARTASRAPGAFLAEAARVATGSLAIQALAAPPQKRVAPRRAGPPPSRLAIQARLRREGSSAERPMKIDLAHHIPSRNNCIRSRRPPPAHGTPGLANSSSPPRPRPRSADDELVGEGREAAAAG